MAHYEINGNKVFIDNILKKQLDKLVIPDLKKKDMDAVFVIDGKERTGKSVFAMSIGGYLSKEFNKKFGIDNICFSALEFRQKVSSCERNEVIIYDEAHNGMGSTGALTETNRLLKDLMMEMGQKNLCVIIVLPTFFLLERYVALFRARGLFHVYTNKHRRGFWVYYNEKNKKRLFLGGKRDFNYNCMGYPRFRGVFTNSYAIDEDIYREKKGKSFTENPRKTKEESAREDKKKFIALLHDEYELSTRKIVDLCKKYNIKSNRQSISEWIIQYSEV